MTLTLIPFAINSVIAGNPSTVAGTLISKFSLSIISHSCFPCLIVAKVSRANRGSTSIETRPSTPLLVSKAVRKRSQAFLTSSVVSFVIISSMLFSLFCKISFRYKSDLPIAAAKILGLVVTPTTLSSKISFFKESLFIRSRDKSSSHTATPACDICANGLGI